MADFKKYMLIPEDNLSKHVPTKKQMSDFDRDMSRILSSDLSDVEKVQRYYELLKRKLNLQEHNLPWTKASKEEEEDNSNAKQKEPISAPYVDVIMNSIPSKFKKQGEKVLALMQRDPNILTWNDRGEVLYHGEKLPKSNIADLFKTMFTDTTHINIAAKQNFLSALEEMNIPRHYVKNKYLLHPFLRNEPPTSPQLPVLRKRPSTENVKRKVKSLLKDRDHHYVTPKALPLRWDNF